MRTLSILPFGDTTHSTRTQPETPLASRGYLGRGGFVMIRGVDPLTSMVSPVTGGGVRTPSSPADAIWAINAAAAPTICAAFTCILPLFSMRQYHRQEGIVGAVRHLEEE